jgi:hypothetical protein
MAIGSVSDIRQIFVAFTSVPKSLFVALPDAEWD